MVLADWARYLDVPAKTFYYQKTSSNLLDRMSFYGSDNSRASIGKQQKFNICV